MNSRLTGRRYRRPMIGRMLVRREATVRRAFAAVLLCLLLPAAPAEAGTQACRQLEAQLAGLSSGGSGGASAQSRRFDTAIARQQEHMNKARHQARRAGCGHAVAGQAVSLCAGLNATIARMERNLADLQARRTQPGSGNARRERARIMAAIDVNGCRAPKQKQAESRPAASGKGQVRSQVTINNGKGAPSLGGNFRTMCVRSCDGYYFPISWSVSSAAFARDANACQAACPGAAVELHYHRVPGEEPDAMVSATTGLPYSEMENAFLHRKPGASTPQGCGCGATGQTARGFTVIAGDHGSGIVPPAVDETARTAAIPKPSGRPDPAEDPETLAAREGGLDAQTLKRLVAPARRTSPQSDSERQIRVVGPVFLPDPEAAIDLQAPDHGRAR